MVNENNEVVIEMEDLVNYIIKRTRELDIEVSGGVIETILNLEAEYLEEHGLLV